MRRPDPPMLGIDLNEREIRIVHVGSKGGRSVVVEAVAAPLPQGAISHGVVMEPATLELALRRLLETMKTAGGAKAVLGISGEQTGFRALSIPPCPDAELPALVEGEMEHQGFRQYDGSPHDFFELFPPVATPDEMRSVAVVGADGAVTQGLCEVAAGVGVAISAIEPTPLAALRTATASLPASATAFFLIVGPSTTDAAYFVNGRLAAFRRLEVGSSSLVQSFAPTVSLEDPTSLSGGAPLTMFGVQLDPSMFQESNEPWSHIDHGALDRLAIEAQRTMDYVQRFDHEAAAIERVVLVADDPELEPMAEMLASRFGLPTVFATLPPGLPDLRFAAAYGLATHAAVGLVETPRIDLFTNQRDEAKRELTKRNFFGSILVSGVAILIGVAGCVLYNRQIAKVTADSRVASDQIAEIKGKTAAILTQRAEDDARYKALRKEGVPLGAIMDYVVGSVDPSIGLKSVTIADDLKLRIGGEARDESALVRTTQGLQASPILADVALERFTRATKEASGVLVFEITGSTVTADRVKEAPKKS